MYMMSPDLHMEYQTFQKCALEYVAFRKAVADSAKRITVNI